MTDAIRLFDENDPLDVKLEYLIIFEDFRLTCAINIVITNGYQFEDTFALCRKNRDQWDRLGKAIGRNTSVRKFDLRWGQLTTVINWAITSEAYECIEAMYRGLELNSSIQRLCIDMHLFPEDDPILKLANIQFKDRLENLTIIGENPISKDKTASAESI